MRTLIWWSGGAASAVAAWLQLRRDPDGIVVRCETNNEDPDNYRFEDAVMNFLHKKPVILKSDRYDSVWDCWQKRRYMAGIDGAAPVSAWRQIPDEAVLHDTGNPTGNAVIWYMGSRDPSTGYRGIRCFIPGAEG